MKKLFAFLLVVVMILSMMVGCGNNTTPGNDTDTKKIETLKVAFVPSREPAEIDHRHRAPEGNAQGRAGQRRLRGRRS